MNDEKLKILSDYIIDQIEGRFRERFRYIINGEGPLVPRIAVKIALDDLFSKERQSGKGEILTPPPHTT